MYQHKRVKPVQTAEVDCLGVEGPPLSDAPDGLEFEEPERNDGEEDEAREERETEEVRADQRGLDQSTWEGETVGRYSRSGHRARQAVQCCSGLLHLKGSRGTTYEQVGYLAGIDGMTVRRAKIMSVFLPLSCGAIEHLLTRHFLARIVGWKLDVWCLVREIE